MAMLTFPIGYAYAWDQKAMNAAVDQTNFLVNKNCSGTLVGANPSYILTAHHCIDQQYQTVKKREIGADGTVHEKEVRIAEPGKVSQLYFKGSSEVQENSYVYKIVGDDEKLDLALLLLQTPISGKSPAKMACTDLQRGDKVYAVGNAYVVLYASVSQGTVASITRSYRDLGLAGQLGDLTDNGEHGLIQHTALISGGNSGGALYNDNGEYVGTNVRGGGGWSFSVPLEDIRHFLNNNGHGNLFGHCEASNG